MPLFYFKSCDIVNFVEKFILIESDRPFPQNVPADKFPQIIRSDAGNKKARGRYRFRAVCNQKKALPTIAATSAQA